MGVSAGGCVKESCYICRKARLMKYPIEIQDFGDLRRKGFAFLTGMTDWKIA